MKLELKKRKNGMYYFVLKMKNGYIVMYSQDYASLSGVTNSYLNVAEKLVGVEIEEI